jgi:hypothetical protein
MTEPVEPKPEFRSLPEDAVIAALQDLIRTPRTLSPLKSPA